MGKTLEEMTRRSDVLFRDAPVISVRLLADAMGLTDAEVIERARLGALPPLRIIKGVLAMPRELAYAVTDGRWTMPLPKPVNRAPAPRLPGKPTASAGAPMLAPSRALVEAQIVLDGFGASRAALKKLGTVGQGTGRTKALDSNRTPTVTTPRATPPAKLAPSPQRLAPVRQAKAAPAFVKPIGVRNSAIQWVPVLDSVPYPEDIPAPVPPPMPPKQVVRAKPFTSVRQYMIDLALEDPK